MPFKGSLKIPVIGSIVFLTLCFIALGGLLSGSNGLKTTEAKVIEVTRGIENTDSGFSYVYNAIRVQYDYRGEKYTDSIEEDLDLGNVNPGDPVKVSFNANHPNAIVEIDVPTTKDAESNPKVSGWEIFAIMVLAFPMAFGILAFMMFLDKHGNKPSSRRTAYSRVK